MAAAWPSAGPGLRSWRTTSKRTAASLFLRRFGPTWARIASHKGAFRLGPGKFPSSRHTLEQICYRMKSHINLQRSEAILAAPQLAVSPMGAIWRTIRGYILWSYERGSLHYDIMVTLILIFVFVSPHFINYKDKPVERNPHLTGVVVIPGEKGEFIYQIQASAVNPASGGNVRRPRQR